ncbi:SAM-dependent methyltransferase [Planctomycetota bacterium]
MKRLIDLMERGMLPDPLIRRGIRRLNRHRLRLEYHPDPADQLQAKMDFIQQLRHSEIAVETDKANQQHYELPPSFFQKVLGPHLKYSCCLWEDGIVNLEQAEQASLKQICQRAQISDGMDILELGCGWGSLTLWVAQHYPKCNLTAVSNSALQREFIQNQCDRQQLNNIEIITADANVFTTKKTFDRIVSIEMFEHMRNYHNLLYRINQWLKLEGKLFIHIFVHRDFPYFFETQGEDDWMGQYFFTGGMMPSDDLLHYFQDDLILEYQWRLSGMHYYHTAQAWLEKLDHAKDDIMPILADIYGHKEAPRWFQRWRVFFMACAELWGYNNGKEWWVSHYRFRKR